MSRHARQADHAYLQRRARERAPRLVVGQPMPVTTLRGQQDRACKCGYIDCICYRAKDGDACQRSASRVTWAAPRVTWAAPQPAPEPQATRFSVGDVVRAVADGAVAKGTLLTVSQVTAHGISCGAIGGGFSAFELVRRADEATAPAVELREGWREANRYEWERWAFGPAPIVGNRVTRVPPGTYEAIFREGVIGSYPTLDAAMDAVEAAVLASEGWTRNGDNGGCYWKHERGAEVSLSRARKAWAYAPNGECRWVSAESWPKTRGEAMRLALGQVTR